MQSAYLEKNMIEVKESKSTKTRNMQTRASNIELLRIIAMLGIILHHCVFHGQALNYVTGYNRLYTYFIIIFGKVGVTIFISITSFFLCEKKTTVNQFVRVWMQSFLYYIFLLIFSIIIRGGESISIITVLRQFLPIVGDANWYVSNFLIFLIIIPFLNLLISPVRRKSIFAYITLFFSVIIVVLPSLGVTTFYSDIMYFVCIYFIIVYLKDRNFIVSINYRLFFMLLFLSIITIFISEIVSGNANGWATRNYSIFTTLIGISSFCLFSRIEVPHNRLINYLAKHTFGVFLLHTANLLRYDFIWQEIFKCDLFFTSRWYIIWTLGSSFIVFSFGVVIDTLMMILIDKTINLSIFKNYINSANAFCKKLLDS